MNLNELREAMASDATKENASLKEENARREAMASDATDCVRWLKISEEIIRMIQML